MKIITFLSALCATTAIYGQFSAGVAIDRFGTGNRPSYATTSYAGIQGGYIFRRLSAAFALESALKGVTDTLGASVTSVSGGGVSPVFMRKQLYSQPYRFREGLLKINLMYVILEPDVSKTIGHSISAGFQYTGNFAFSVWNGKGTIYREEGNNSNQQHQYTVTSSETSYTSDPFVLNRYVSSAGLIAGYRVSAHRIYMGVELSAGAFSKGIFTPNAHYFPEPEDDHPNTTASGNIFRDYGRPGRVIYASVAVSLGVVFGRNQTKKG